MIKYIKIPIVILVAIALSGCQGTYSRGVRLDKDSIEAIKTGHLGREQVEELLGSPTMISDYTPNTWYYVSRVARDKVWSRPSVKKQMIVKVTFTGDFVSHVEVIDKKPVVKFSVDRDDTAVKGTEENALQTFVKNFGRFNKTNRKQRR
ncbi:MAG: hypothetical protein RLZZ59_424 [Pseudomonadota bacterium]|jgi:outer membrane protein assembly factor BamE (lipoprotein component of BamABCDE complex)